MGISHIGSAYVLILKLHIIILGKQPTIFHMSYKHKIALTSQYMMSSNPKIIAKNSSTQGTLGSNPKKHLNHTIQFLNKKIIEMLCHKEHIAHHTKSNLEKSI